MAAHYKPAQLPENIKMMKRVSGLMSKDSLDKKNYELF
jgi:hypothetical protein